MESLNSARIADLTQQDERHEMEVDQIQKEGQNEINKVNDQGFVSIGNLV